MIPKAVWLIKDKRSMWLFGWKVSCLIGCVCCVTVHWYSELEHSHNTEYFLYSRYRTCSQTAMFQLECKSLFLKEPFCTWVARVNEIVKRSNKSQTTLRGGKKTKTLPLLMGTKTTYRQSAATLHLLCSPVAKFVPELSVVLFFSLLCTTKKRWFRSSEGMKICLVAK